MSLLGITGMLSRKILKNYAIWCVLKLILVKRRIFFIIITHIINYTTIKYLHKEQNFTAYKNNTPEFTTL